MKRFYKDTGVDEGEGGFRVLLDGKPMRSPGKAVLEVPTRALAEAMAYNLTHTAGSVVIALAVSEGRLDAAGAFAAAQMDELYQVDRWGDDPIAEKQREGVRRDIEACARLLSLLENARLRG